MVYSINFLREVQDYIDGYRDLSIAEITHLVRKKFDIDISIDEVETLYFRKIPPSVEELLERLKIGMSRGELKMLELITKELPPIYECGECGRYYSHTEATPFKYRGALFCPSCYKAHFRKCEGCGIILHEYDATRDASRRYYCSNCAGIHLLYCTHCGEYHPKENITRDGNGDICLECFNYDYYSCCECGEYVHHTHVLWDGNIPYCEECYPDIIEI